ncbi:MAG: MBL fold metallo-hydrolase [Clostridia bacterium]|nr:MBL fold metallo-hydrolase [Clostridia bacterium]
MQVIKVYPAGFASNSYIVTGNGTTCAVIDCAQPKVLDKCKQLNLQPECVLLTHGHYDHVGGCAAFQSAGVPIMCGKGEKDLIFSDGYMSLCAGSVPRFTVDKTFSDGDEFEAAGVKFKVIATPGHSAGGVTYLAEDCLFTGDTLFCGSVGRTDLPTGSSSQLVRSVKKLYALNGDYIVYCGHEDDTTLQAERFGNYYIQDDNAQH